ncbi:hypothetical protein BGZ61DRAFT_535723 [Ilyonectria robusta]|uniref:uncharacterized protein n=1 Tax=Ilyonectria robusta TaxID=1079257 RepID=UPI001E8DF22D|nr:uncharacterized protein BGZ61DRAFT_535723 [Ilyonectria robusta]KAH8679322.1 hypothetical protein BGZ61DRAFT_535723 [Ilyonectria robusta]
MSPNGNEVPSIACTRCRHRKKKCDQILPSCGQCTKSGAPCVRFAERKPRAAAAVPWEYVHGLETRIEQMERTLAECVAELRGAHRLTQKLNSPHGFVGSDCEQNPSLNANDELMQHDSDSSIRGHESEWSSTSQSATTSKCRLRTRNDLVEDNSVSPTSQHEITHDPRLRDLDVHPRLEPTDDESGVDLVSPSNLDGYLKHVHPIWSFMEEDLLKQQLQESMSKEAAKNNSQLFFAQLACAIGCFYSNSSTPSRDAIRQSTTRQLQAYLLIVMYAIHSPAPYQFFDTTNEALSKMAGILSAFGRHVGNTEPDSIDREGNRPLFLVNGQEEKHLKTVLIYSYSAYELMALAWDRPHGEFMELMDGKAWNQAAWNTFDGAPQDVVFDHQFLIRLIQTKIRRFWNESERLDLEEQRQQRKDIKADLDRWRALIPFTSSNIERSTNYHPLSMLKLYDYSVCNLYQQGDYFPTDEDCLVLLSAVMEQFRVGVTLLACYWETPYLSRTIVFDSPDTLQALEDCEFTLLRFSQRWEAAKVYHRTFKLLLSQTPLSFPDNSTFTFPEHMANEFR